MFRILCLFYGTVAAVGKMVSFNLYFLFIFYLFIYVFMCSRPVMECSYVSFFSLCLL